MKNIIKILGLLICVSIYSQDEIETDIVRTTELYVQDTAIRQLIINNSPATSVDGANGLSKTGNNIELGGSTLNKDVEILGGGYDVDFGTSGSRTGTFKIYSNSTTTFAASTSEQHIVNGSTWNFDGTYWINTTTNDTLQDQDQVYASIIANLPYTPLSNKYIYSTTTTDSRPGIGYFRLNNATYSNVTEVYIDYYDNNSVDKSDFYSLPDTGSYLLISDGTNYINYKITGGSSAAGSYVTYGVTYINNSGVISGLCDLNLDLSSSSGGTGGAVDSTYSVITAEDTLKTPYITDNGGNVLSIVTKDQLLLKAVDGDSTAYVTNNVAGSNVSSYMIVENDTKDALLGINQDSASYYHNGNAVFNADENSFRLFVPINVDKSYIKSDTIKSNNPYTFFTKSLKLNHNNGLSIIDSTYFYFINNLTKPRHFTYNIRQDASRNTFNYELYNSTDTEYLKNYYYSNEVLEIISDLSPSTKSVGRNMSLSTASYQTYAKGSTGYNAYFYLLPESYQIYTGLQNSTTFRYNYLILDSNQVRFRRDDIDYFKADTIGIYAPYASFSDSVYSPKGRYDTIIIAEDTAVGFQDAQTAIESIDFDKLSFNPQTNGTYSEGNIYYSDVKKNFVTKNNVSQYSGDVNREINLRFYNATGDALSDGVILRSVGSYITAEGDTIFQGGYAGNGSLDSLIGIAMVTAPCAIGAIGECTILGRVNGLGHGLADNTVLYMGNEGVYTTTPPAPPEIYTVIGRTVGSEAIYFSGLSVTKYIQNPKHAGDTSGISQVVSITSAGVYTKIPISLAQDRIDIGFNEAGDSLQVLVEGDYDIHLGLSWSGGSADNWRYGVFVNGVRQYYQVTKTASADVVADVVIISRYLHIGDWISFRITNTTDADDPTLITLSYSITYTD